MARKVTQGSELKVARAGLRVRQDGDGWLAEGLPGWEGYRVWIAAAAVIDGAPRVTGLRVEAIEGAEPPGLTSARLRSLPVLHLATLVINATHTAQATGDIRAAVRRAVAGKAVKHDPRAFTTLEAVADIWHAARAAGKPTQAAIVAALPIRPRTADLYVKRAREAGLIEPAEAPQTPEGKSPSGNRKKETR